jgi:hypothetical protein
MAGIKISNLPPVVTPTLSDELPTVQAGVTYRVSNTQLATLFGGGGVVNPGVINQLGYYAATGSAISGLATANKGLLITSNVGAPSILSSPNTTGQILQSNAAAPVSFSSASYPSITTANQILYSSSNNAVAGLATGNDGTLITSAAGVPSISSTLPTVVQGNITQLGAQSQALNMNTHLINNVVDPVSPQDAATKNYVDQTALSGTTVYAASAASLGTVTQAGAGVGATLTNAGAQATFALDGVSPPLNSNVLIKNTATGMAAENEGIYTVTDVGSVITNWVLTRATTYDTPAEINGTGLIVVQNGSTLAGTAWYNGTTIVTVDTTAFSYTQFGSISFPISVMQGGTGADLSASVSNGGIFYSTATAGAILAGTATANQMLQSGSSSAPHWSTSTWPATTTANQILYSSATNTVAGLTSANSAALVTTSAGVPVLSSTMTNGQVIIGSTGATPVAASLTAGSNITITPGAGTITIAAAGGGASAFTQVVPQVFAGSGTYTPTSGMKYCIIECIGGGGAGGGAASINLQCGGGGGGGAGGYSRKVSTAAEIGASQTVTIGAGGTAGAAGANAGNAGGDTSVGTICIGKGGSGGAGCASGSQALGGLGGVAGTGDFVPTGSPGGLGIGNAVVNFLPVGGYGGCSALGGGGLQPVGTAVTNNGNAATNYGSGGSGGSALNATGAAVGGVGRAGVVIITEFV